jgi:hypothetical protein
MASSFDCAEGKGAGAGVDATTTDGGVVRSDGAAGCVSCLFSV